MLFQTVKSIVTSKNLSAQLKAAKIMKLEGELIFYHAGIETGLFKVLGRPLTSDQAAEKLDIQNKQLLSSLLDLGVSIKEISYKKGKYRLKGSMARALADNIPLAAIIRETVQYHGDVARRLDTYLLKNEKGSYLNDFGGLIAESSRILEPLIKAFIYHSIKKKDPLTILEIGCGAGEYLKYYVDINKNNNGVAIDIDPSAVAIAEKKLKENNLGDNFEVLQENILKPETIENRRFDLVTSFSNMHYFSDDDRKKLYEEIHKLLKNSGRFMLATGSKSSTLSSSYYDLIFASTKDLYPLPEIDTIKADLKNAGFGRVKKVNYFGKSFKCIAAYK